MEIVGAGLVKNEEIYSSGYKDDVVKDEYVVKDYTRTLSIGCLSEKDKEKLINESIGDEPKEKKRKVSGKLKGQNKGRPKTFIEEKCNILCPNMTEGVGSSCSHVGCSFLHDVQKYIAMKGNDLGPICYVYTIKGYCPRGVTCRFGSSHITPEGKNVSAVIEKCMESPTNPPSFQESNGTYNSLDKETQVSLWKKKYDFDASQKAIDSVDREQGKRKERQEEEEGGTRIGELGEDRDGEKRKEKKKIDWSGKLYLAPLTTVGNLPFRRICVEYGADITCGEMSMAKNLLQGQKAEWALIKRHSSEKLFGVQICGNNQYIMTKCAQMLQEKAKLDFIDINLGCPLDFIHDQGSGSGLLRRERVLKNVIKCAERVSDVPITLKTRTGLVIGKNIVHNYMEMFRDSGASLISVHGRTRDQRYSKCADWDYIEECAKLAHPTPVFGNGDILSYEDYEHFLSRAPSVSGVMIGRGALMKPWIFREIKEKKHLDVSSSERFEMLKRYTDYGLEHWGSDTRGVETTRRFLLEWLSFLYRYIPVGLLKSPPQKMNTRPPSSYRGRDELETLMASQSAEDWVKISEMLLGPVPEGFTFLPKHKARAWK